MIEFRIAATFIKNYGAVADKALSEPVTITKNGRDRLICRDRRAIRPEDLSEDDLALIAKAEVPAKYAHLDAELT